MKAAQASKKGRGDGGPRSDLADAGQLAEADIYWKQRPLTQLSGTRKKGLQEAISTDNKGASRITVSSDH